jgi:plastocyanin
MRAPRLLCRAIALLVAVALLALAGCGGGGGETSSGATSEGGTATVAVKDYSFAPGRLTVAKGTTVSFTNHDSTAHTATADSGSGFDTGTVAPGKTKSVTFEKPGTYTYHCAFHPFMKGTITVKP